MELPEHRIKELRKKPSEFVRAVLDNGKEPYPYQEEILDSNHHRKAITTGRQCGKTTMMAWMAIHEFVMFPDRQILLTAPTQRQALNFMDKLKAEIDDWIDNPDEYGLETVQKSKIKGKNGSSIRALPAIKETIRGLTIDSVFADEAAFIERNILVSVISPMLATTDGQFVLGSTPWGTESYFHDKIEKDENWFSRRVASMECPEIPPEQIEEWRRDMTQQEFEREVLAQFTDKQNAFFENRDMNRSLEWANELPDGSNVIYPDRKSRSCFLGVDPAGGGGDAAVFTTVDETGRVFDVIKDPDMDIPEVEGQIRSLLTSEDRNYVHGYVEENGLGEGIVGHLEDEFREIEGFRTTIRSKESIYGETKKKMQEGKLHVPDREDLKKQMRKMEYEMTSRGNKQIFPPDDGSDDMIDSLCLAVGSWTGTSDTKPMSSFVTIGQGNNTTRSSDEGRGKSFRKYS